MDGQRLFLAPSPFLYYKRLAMPGNGHQRMYYHADHKRLERCREKGPQSLRIAFGQRVTTLFVTIHLDERLVLANRITKLQSTLNNAKRFVSRAGEPGIASTRVIPVNSFREGFCWAQRTQTGSHHRTLNAR